jgi:hypothetical protein
MLLTSRVKEETRRWLAARNSAWPSPGRHDGSLVRVLEMHSESLNIETNLMQALNLLICFDHLKEISPQKNELNL